MTSSSKVRIKKIETVSGEGDLLFTVHPHSFPDGGSADEIVRAIFPDLEDMYEHRSYFVFLEDEDFK